MIFSKELGKWYAKIQSTLFNYKDGFFHLKFESKTPQKMIEDFDKLPFVKHNLSKQEIQTNNPVMKVKIKYHEIQQGIWLLVSESEYKLNVVFNPTFDDTIKEEYYFLNLSITNFETLNKAILLNGIPLTNNIWTVVKPRAYRTLSYFKNTIDKNITLYFKKELLNSNIESLNLLKSGVLNSFLNSDNPYLSSKDTESKEALFKTFLEIISLENGSEKTQKLIYQLNLFVDSFVRIFKEERLSENYYVLSDYDRKNIIEIEYILTENLMVSFPGIEILASHIGVSTTKLKNDFKKVHQTSIFQFYRNKQLEFTHTILKNKSLKIKHLASLFGYENSSKFSAAFKNKYGYSPSEIAENKIKKVEN